MKTINEQHASHNPVLDKMVECDSDLKNMIVEYVGINSEKYIHYGGEDNKVTVQMIVDIFAKEFPEFLLVVAEENWVRGYHQALADVEFGKKAEQEENKEIPDEEWVSGYRDRQATLEGNE